MNPVAAPVRNLYVHVPYCDGKCLYCAFYSVRGGTGELQTYAAFPGMELERRLSEGLRVAPETVYMGGGTPAALGVGGLRALADGLRRRVPFDSVAEWTAEVTPPTASAGVLRALRAMGVTRISMGAQCFDDGVLRALGRRHTAAEVANAVRRIRAEGFGNFGLDLIAGLPGMSNDSWMETLQRAIALEPAHLSVYALTLEPGSGLARQVARGLVLPGDAAQTEALAQAEAALTAAGFSRYEISNYARPGFACRHNLACWRGEDYLGLGPSAASRLGRMRRTVRADAAAYGAALAASRPPPDDEETLDPADDAAERFVFAVRLAEGCEPRAHARRWPAAAPLAAAWERKLAALARNGITEACAPGRWRLTSRGREVADAVSRELLAD